MVYSQGSRNHAYSIDGEIAGATHLYIFVVNSYYKTYHRHVGERPNIHIRAKWGEEYVRTVLLREKQ